MDSTMESSEEQDVPNMGIDKYKMSKKVKKTLGSVGYSKCAYVSNTDSDTAVDTLHTIFEEFKVLVRHEEFERGKRIVVAKG
jgi:hypothetical protein